MSADFDFVERVDADHDQLFSTSGVLILVFGICHAEVVTCNVGGDLCLNNGYLGDVWGYFYNITPTMQREYQLRHVEFF